MDNKKVVLYALFVIVGWYIVSQNIDRMTHANPPETFFGQDPNVMYAVPLFALVLIHYGLDWLKLSKPEIAEHGTPLAFVFIINPNNQDELAKTNWLTYKGNSKYLFILNAQRKYKQKHKGQRIICCLEYDKNLQRKLENAVEYPYIYDDCLSHEELANYVLEQGDVMMWDKNYRFSIHYYPKLIDVGNIKILEYKGMPSGGIEELITSLVSGGYSGTANDILERTKETKETRAKR